MNVLVLSSIKLLLLVPLTVDHSSSVSKEPSTNPNTAENFMLHVPGHLIRIGDEEDVRRSFPVSQCFAGATVRGHGELTGSYEQQLVGSDRHALWAVNFNGTNSSQTRATQQRVTVRQRGTLQFESRGEVRFDFSGFRTRNVATTGSLRTRTTSISTPFRGIRRRIALRRVRERSGSNRRIAERVGLRQASQSFRKELQTAVSRMNRDYQSQVITPLTENDIYPKSTRVVSRNNAVHVGLCFADTADEQFATPREDFYDGKQLRLAVHQAAVNYTSRPLAGETRSLSATLRNVVSGKAKSDGSDADLKIRFADAAPFVVSFNEKKLNVTLHAEGFERAGQVYRGMEISFTYRSEENEGLQSLVLDEKPLVHPPLDENGNRPKLGLRDVSLRRILVNILERDLPEQISVAELELPIPSGLLLPLEPVKLQGENGWLLVEAVRKSDDKSQPTEMPDALANAD